MTEFWVSQKRHWCDYCKVWLNDTLGARSVHENGIKHKENVARKLREMRQKGDDEQREAELLARSWSSIEAKAKAQFEKDVRAGLVDGGAASGFAAPLGPAARQRAQDVAERAAAEEAADKAIKASAEAEHRLTGGALSKWEHDPGSGYLYNSALRYYHDTKSGWYFGGDPPCWTQNPPIPEVARYERFYQAPEEEQGGAGPLPQGRPGLSTTMGAGVAQRNAAAVSHPQPQPQATAVQPQARPQAPQDPMALTPAAAAPAVPGAARVQTAKASKHPMQTIGGFQLHHLGGTLGAARSLGVQKGGVNKRKAEEAGKTGAKKDKKSVSKEEAEALARREAARARVEKRTLGQFGLI